MKKLVLLFVLLYSVTAAQLIESSIYKKPIKRKALVTQADFVKLSKSNQQKVLSGKLIENISRKQLAVKKSPIITSENITETVVIYTENYPSSDNLLQLSEENIDYYIETWTPPLENHPFGYFLASMPVDKLEETLSLNFIKKMDTAEYETYAQNNNGIIAINADDVWSASYDGTGVTVAVLDSGLDYAYDGTDLPSSYQKRDYSAYPTTDADVENTVSGHGTHVTGSVLGRGSLSSGRSDEGNGSTAFKGSAPDASLVFLKIGSDADATASSAAIIAAMDAAVSTYNADIITMSYGGWYTYHDGSSSTEQKVDDIYTNDGVPVFISAGNDANDAHHYSGTVGGNSSTGFISISAVNGSRLSFNLVWYDGTAIDNDLEMKYYNGSQVELTNTTQNATTESTRGTHSKISYHNTTVSAGTYYVKVFNNSSNSQEFHIYFYNQGDANLTFDSPDQEYTIGQPASADNAFAVGAWTTRDSWKDYSGSVSVWTFGETSGSISSFSSRGPRVDGGATKPNIVAPGSAIISLRDTDVLTTASEQWIDNDGNTSAGDANYYVMQGTSMACPIAAGAAALLLDKYPSATPSQIYSAIQDNASTSGTGSVPNSTWGYGKLDVFAASNDPALPVELTSFEGTLQNQSVLLSWETATETNNYGFDIEKSSDSENFAKIGFLNGYGTTNSPKYYEYTDADLPEKDKVWYRLKQIDNDGQTNYSKIIAVDISTITGIEDETKKLKFNLAQNYPNPFNPATLISYSLKSQSNVTLTLVNPLGQVLETLVSENQSAGKHEIYFNAEQYSSGIYLYRLQAKPVDGSQAFVQSKKMILIR